MKPARLLHYLIHLPRGSEKGQSAVEYLVVTGALIISLITLPSIYQTVSHTMQNKYRSYAFGIAISDPPSLEFDHKVNHSLDIVQEIEDVIDELKLDIKHGKLPGLDTVKKFFDLVNNLL